MTQANSQPAVGKKTVLLTGFSGAGKTEVGLLLQQRHGLSWVDLDRYIERNSSKRVAEIIRVEGEEAFRSIEHESLKEVLKKGTQVISLGGGALAVERNQALVKNTSVVVYLKAEVETLVQRVLNDEAVAIKQGRPGSRPMLFDSSGELSEIDLREKVQGLFEKRKSAYEQANLQVATDFASIASVTEAVWLGLQLEGIGRITIFPEIESEQLGTVVVGVRLIPYLDKFLCRTERNPKICILIDENVRKHWGESLRQYFEAKNCKVCELKIPAGESSKRLELVEGLCEQMLEFGISRDDVVLGVGGGVVGDIAGLASSLYMRGIGLVHLPTSVVAQVDSAIGGKTGVNLKGGKNTVGTFRSAEFTLNDPSTLSTLPEREFRSGLAEVLKYGLISEPSLYYWMEQNSEKLTARTLDELTEIVERSVATKLKFIVGDVSDLKGNRAKLNFGHTLGHAVEKLAGYGTLLHGEAVSIGMAFALFVGEVLGLTEAGLRIQTANILQKLVLPVAIPRNLADGASEYLREKGIDKLEKLFAAEVNNSAELSEKARRYQKLWYDALSADKKRSSDSVSFVVVSELGCAENRKIEVERLIGCAAWYAQAVAS